MSQEQEKIIKDPIHEYITFKKWAVEFIDTEEFQRLRDIKQLGASNYVFPSACHNRFEHSLGIEKGETDLECVTLAALCHDLGHGPFSHVFDNDVIPAIAPGLEWKHEDGSEMMLDRLYNGMKSPSIDLNTDDLKYIKNLIKGDRTERSPYLFDIVANKRNSVDVDKFDYLARDCYYLGMNSLFDSSRLMKFSYVIDDQIVQIGYHHKEYFNIYEMFHTRYSLHKRIYNHRVTRAINFMIRDALVKANSKYHFEEIVLKPDEFIKLDDSILNEIVKSEGLGESKKIIKRIRQRKLYKFVNECIIPENRAGVTKENLNEFEIASNQSGNTLSKDDIIVDWQDLNYAKKDSNPLESVKFYNKDRTMVLDLKPERISHLFPEQYQERIVRIFSRDPQKVDSIHNAFKKLARKLDLNVNEGFLTGEKVDVMDLNPNVDSQYNKNEDRKTIPFSDG
ncbi:12395_t:CDS:10 [Racocetra persica]|uniref:12395_t:CDS:1 n=1 Tax=Racocetra persica TaxID=160502 RepID=A0ACA9MTV6_9GLOM|nr:12395_t:CDS:10 [Racocetra persica]